MTEIIDQTIQTTSGNTVDDALNGALHQLVVGNGWDEAEAADFLRRATAPMVERLEARRVRIVKAEADLLDIRGLLSPNGQPRRVPMELGATVAPAVSWLLGRITALTEDLAKPQVRTVAGECPMGCGPTLYLDHADQITCAHGDCKRPHAAGEILSNGETAHIAHLGPSDFTLTHPLAENLDGQILRCRISRTISTAGSPPQPVGSYRVNATPAGLEWTPMAPQPVTTHRAEPDSDRG